MKIIASTNKDRTILIVEMSRTELAKITGKGASYSNIHSDECDSGNIFDIDERFSQLNEMSSIPSTIAAVKKNIEDCLLRINKAEAAAMATDFKIIKHR